jgi:hypothetical protein
MWKEYKEKGEVAVVVVGMNIHTVAVWKRKAKEMYVQTNGWREEINIYTGDNRRDVVSIV